MKWLCLFLSVPLNSHAIFQKLYTGYKSSERLYEIKIADEFAKIDLELGKDKFDWNLTAGYDQSDSFLQGLFSFNTQRTIKDTKTIGFSKSSYRYGTFALSHEQTNYDLSRWSSNSLGDNVYEAKNVLTYSYEILNDSSSQDWELVHLQNKSDRISNKLITETDHLDFFKAYLEAKHKIMLDQLYKDFKAKGKKRVLKMRKRVRDGLSRKVDLNQANLALLNQEEMVLKNRAELRMKISIIENVIKQEIPESKYTEVAWTYKPYQKFGFYMLTPDYDEMKRIKILNEIGELKISQYDESINHSLKLSLRYGINAFDEEQGSAFSEATGASSNDEKVIALNYSLPLGISKKYASKRKLYLQKMKSKLSYRNRKSELDIQTKIVRENVKRYQRGIRITAEKISYAEKIQRENQRLYARGKVSFEETLRADESLINTKISFMNMMYIYEFNLAELAFLNGKVKMFLEKYKD